MLTQLLIQNFAIVDHLDLDLKVGMTVISGETGAGKSIMLDALALALGDRADSDSVRLGAERAEITALFDLTAIPEAREWLAAQDLDMDNECQLRRVITREGRSRSYINGQPTPLNLVRELGQFLVDIHGQHEHQRLLKKDFHRVLLDDFAQQTALALDVKQHYQHWQGLQKRLQRLTDDSAEKTARLQLLSYQLNELNQLDLREGELEQLEQEQQQLENAGSLLQTGHQVLQLTAEGEGEQTTCLELLSHSLQLLEGLQKFSPLLPQAADMLSSAQIQIEEASREIRHFIDQVEMNPERLQEVEERLSSIYDIARKHRVAPEALCALHRQLEAEMAGLEQSDEAIEQLQHEADQARLRFLQQAQQLSQKRSSAALALSQAVDQQLHSLGMASAHFRVQLTPLDSQHAGAQGLEEVEFLISTNKGQSAKPLAKVASGGELSRISLAIQVITAQTSSTPTLVFDEVDVGIGGAIAEVVGRLLKELGQRTQVLCVTHQPQVAAQGDQHLHVSKIDLEHATATQIQRLESDARIQEIARMLGGIELTSTTLKHAKEMLKH